PPLPVYARNPISVSLSASVIWVTLQLRSGRWSSARNKTAPEQRLHSTMKTMHTGVHVGAHRVSILRNPICPTPTS
ncbi:hypothetical protein K0M31_012201, partial [Melipona bicolor]